MADQEGFQGQCPFCGEVTVGAPSLRCEHDPARPEGLCEFACPICSRLVLVRTGVPEVLALRAAGAGGIGGAVPFEVLERHGGSPVTWDEVLDARLALEATDFPHQELSA